MIIKTCTIFGILENFWAKSPRIRNPIPNPREIIVVSNLSYWYSYNQPNKDLKHLMSQKRERFKLSVAVFLFVIKENQILLIKRATTGWMDGFYSVPAGSIDGNEALDFAACREAKEETDLTVSIGDIDLVHKIHCITSGEEWMGTFFATKKFTGEPKLNEPHKHSEVMWCDIDKLPEKIIPYVKQAIEAFTQKNFYSEYRSD